MKLLRNSFISSILIVFSSLLLIALLQYFVQARLTAHNLEQHRQTSDLLLSTIKAGDVTDIKEQLTRALQVLPGWVAAVYNSDGGLVWQSKSGLSELDLQAVDSEKLKHPLLLDEQQWVISQHPLAAAGQNNFTVTLFSSKQKLQLRVAAISNLILLTAVLIGLLIFAFIRFNSRHLKADIRNYIRNHRQEPAVDNLTGLPSRQILHARIDNALSQARRNQSGVAVFYMGLDRFKSINDSYGHAFGDQVLRTIANRLSSTCRESDTLVRIEGDQFVLLMTNYQGDEEVEQVARRIIDSFKKPVSIGRRECTISVTIGISVNDDINVDHDMMLTHAFTAMNALKSTFSSNDFIFFRPEMSNQTIQRAEREAELYNALDNDEFCLYYQPRVDAVTGTIKGMEALIRWQHPQRGLVAPIEFIPVLEESGMIVLVGEWVIKEACRTNKKWQEQGLPPLQVSVNVASPQFKQEGFVEMLKETLDATGLDPAYLEIELTESCLMSDDENNVSILDQIKELGVSISVDDFGTGYSSLSYLKRFPIDTLKIDRSFITNVHDRKDNDNAAIVTAIMALSHSLRLEVVAEGVETPQELAFLQALGCRTIQGFLFSQPIPEDEFRSLQKDSVSLLQTLEEVKASCS